MKIEEMLSENELTELGTLRILGGSDEWKSQYDWDAAFKEAGPRVRVSVGGVSTAPVFIQDVEFVFRRDEGANDEKSWLMVGYLRDGRWFFLEAWCDYTGWDCQAGGDVQVASSFTELVRYGMTLSARQRLKLLLPGGIMP